MKSKKQTKAEFIEKIATLQFGKKSTGKTCPLCGDPKCEWAAVVVELDRQVGREEERSLAE